MAEVIELKLAEALLLRSEYQQRIESLKQRISDNVRIQENDTPHEKPDILLSEIVNISGQLCEIIKRINRNNSKIILPDGQTMAEALVDRDMLLKERSILLGIVSKANERDYRLTHSEVRTYLTVDVAKLQKQIDELSRRYRELDTMIQSTNWTTELE